MPKIDVLLDQMVSRGATVLRLLAGDFPTYELPGGHRSPFGSTPMGGPQLDGLIREILPEDQEEHFKRGQELRFTYSYADEVFRIVTRRFQAGAQIVVGRSPREAPGGATPTQVSGPPAALEPLISRLLREGGSDLYLNSKESAIFRLDGQLLVDSEAGVLGSPSDRRTDQGLGSTGGPGSLPGPAMTPNSHALSQGVSSVYG